MEKHFVTFFAPGSFFAETFGYEIDSWDVAAALKMVGKPPLKPYGFQFTTRSRGPDDLDSKQTAQSGMHFIGGKVLTRAEVEAINVGGKYDTLLSNMRGNGWDRIWQGDGGYPNQPFTADCKHHVLQNA